MKLLLISPKWPDHSLWGQIVFRFPVLSLTSLAALTDDPWEITLVDENVTPIDMDTRPDLVGITVMTPLAPRAYEIADAFRSRGIPVVLGGIHATMMPDEAQAHADAIVIGEAEHLWQTVLADAAAGKLQQRYQAEGHPDLKGLPIARRDLLAPKSYFFTNTLLTTRGCPFDCEFCSVTAFHGRTYRVRPVAEVVDEIARMMEGVKRRFLFFVDDNIVGRPDYAKELFKALIPLKNRMAQPGLSVHRQGRGAAPAGPAKRVPRSLFRVRIPIPGDPPGHAQGPQQGRVLCRCRYRHPRPRNRHSGILYFRVRS